MSPRKRLYPTESVKYMGVKIDANLTWQHHVDDLSIKLNRGNALFSKKGTKEISRLSCFKTDSMLRYVTFTLNVLMFISPDMSR